MPKPVFDKLFVPNTELLKVVLGVDHEADSYLLAQQSLRVGLYDHANRLARKRVKAAFLNIHQIEEAAELAIDKVLDRACRWRLSYITDTEITNRIKDIEPGMSKIDRGHGWSDEGEFDGPQTDSDNIQLREFLAFRSATVHRVFVERVLSDLCTLSSRSWLYYRLAAYRTYGNDHQKKETWKGAFADVYIDNGDNAAVSRIGSQVKTIGEQVSGLSGIVCVDGLIDSSLSAFMKLVLTNCEELVDDDADFTADEQFRIPLLQQSLTALNETRPESGFVSDKYPTLCNALNSLSELLTDGSRVDQVKTAAAELVKAAGYGGIVECGALIPWLESLPQSHPREYDCEDVLIGIQELPMRLADKPTVSAVRKSRKGFGDYEGFVNGMFAAVQSQQPDSIVLECVHQCMTRSEALKFIAGEPGLSPAALLQENEELLDEMNRVIECWLNGEARTSGSTQLFRNANDILRDTESIFPGIQLGSSVLEDCSTTLRLWAVPGVVPQSWAEVDDVIRTPLLAAIVIGSMGRLRSALKSVHAQLPKPEKKAAKEQANSVE